MRLSSFLLFYKAFSFLTALVLSSCLPDITDRNFYSINLPDSDSRFNVDLREFNIKPGTNIIAYNSGTDPAFNEIFLLKQPIAGAYEFMPFADFYRTLTIEFNTTSGNFVLYTSNTNETNQRFSIECDVCNSNINSADWTRYHTSCSIKNLASNFCVSGVRSNPSEAGNNLIQVNCANAPKWDIFGMLLSDVPSTPTIISTITSTGGVSTNKLAAAVTGSILGTALIAFVTGYLFIKYHKQSKQFNENDLVNNQVISHAD